MDRDDFRLALKELHILTGFDLETEAAPYPGFQRVKNIKSSDQFHLFIKEKDGDITEVVKFCRKAPRRMSPEAFLKEVGSNIMDGKGASIE
jgi:hypothetical protein